LEVWSIEVVALLPPDAEYIYGTNLGCKIKSLDKGLKNEGVFIKMQLKCLVILRVPLSKNDVNKAYYSEV